MNVRILLSMMAGGVLAMAVTAGAQEKTAGTTDPNEIFTSIMQTMPGEMKARVDSASALRRSYGEDKTNGTSVDGKNGRPAFIDAKQASIDKLPEAVRDQVRKTMQELEEENIERMLQFKDAQNQKNSR